MEDENHLEIILKTIGVLNEVLTPFTLIYGQLVTSIPGCLTTRIPTCVDCRCALNLHKNAVLGGLCLVIHMLCGASATLMSPALTHNYFWCTEVYLPTGLGECVDGCVSSLLGLGDERTFILLHNYYTVYPKNKTERIMTEKQQSTFIINVL